VLISECARHPTLIRDLGGAFVRFRQHPNSGNVLGVIDRRQIVDSEPQPSFGAPSVAVDASNINAVSAPTASVSIPLSRDH
jgi:hypothetical protein